MNVSELVGAIATSILSEELSADADEAAQGTSRFLLDFGADHTAAIARAVLADPCLHPKVEIKLSASHVGCHGLPQEVLTDYPVTFFRNATCPKDAFLLAGGEHSEEASFHEISRLSPAELLDRIDLWIRTVSEGLHLSEDHCRWWERALTGLRDLRMVSLDQFATYVLHTRQAIEAEGLPMLFALGAALPALRLPRDSYYFNIVKEKQRTWPSAWRKHFTVAQRRRGCFLLKQRPTQLFLTEDELIAAFNRVRDSILDVHHRVIDEFISAPGGWNAKAASLAECEWEDIKPLFDGLQRERFNLGQATLDFYDEREPDLLSDEDSEYLQLLVKRKTTGAEEEDFNFFEAHRNELKDDRKLKAAWDRFIFGQPIETVDFLAGIAAAMQPLLNRAPDGKNRKLHIRCDRVTKRDLRELNVQAGLYFAHRYAGLRRMFGSLVTWEVGDLLNFPKLVEGWRERGAKNLNRSVAKAALQLKFTLELETETDTGDIQTCSAQLVWQYEPNSAACQFADDWERLAQHPFLACRAAREFAGVKAKAKTVDLSDVKTFVPAFDRDRGSFIPVYKPDRDIARQWRKNLSDCLGGGMLAPDTVDRLKSRFDAFEDAYTRAVEEFAEKGAGNTANLEQLEAYAALLETIVSLAKGDRNRDLLLKPILQIGTAPVDGGASAAIVAPWHPLRLAAMWRKAALVSELTYRLLSAPELAGDTRLFFKDLERDLTHPLYPEIAVIWIEASPQLLSLSDVVQDYSLHEPPVLASEGSDETNDSPVEGSACVLDLVRRYLTLHPHERANMSVVLFNCDSGRLPQAVVEKVGTIHQDDDEIRCQVLLRHIDAERLRDVYRSILGSDTTADAYSPSEATQDFMAKLRISVIADQAPPPDPQDGCPYDIVFSQDVISRHAKVEWYLESADPPADFRTLLPSRWSRRRPAAADDLKSAVFLCCPVQSAEGWSYLTAIATLFRGDWDDDRQRRLLPVRQLDFRDGRTARIFRETHDLGNWVVNFDELLDRRQLLNQDVRVIRYKQSATQGRNLIISSRAPLGLLRSMVFHRLRVLGLDLSDDELRGMADRLIGDANDVSGDIVLRAAKRGQSASELIGVVLSRHLVREELGRDRHCGWYFLDDYAAWMGQREEQLADILAISPQETADGVLRVNLIVTEAKYIELENLAAKRKESQKQLRDTVRRLNDAIFGDPDRFERESWLARLSDLVLDGIRLPAASGIDLGKWRRAIREGRCEFDIRGYSHIFVPTASDGAECTDVSEVPETPNAFQETYGRPALKQLLQAYWQNQDTHELRRQEGADYLAEGPDWKRPSSGGPDMPFGTHSTRPPPPQPDAGSGSPKAAPADAPTSAGSNAEAGSRSQPDAQPDMPTEVNGWAYPGIGQLLSTSSQKTNEAEQHAWLTRLATATKSALQQIQLQAKLFDSALTPNSALLKFAGSANMTVDQVLRRRSELLTTFGLNVISVRPEPGAVVVAVERPEREVVSAQELWSHWRPGNSEWGNQDILIGVRENDGSQLFLSPSRKHAPHTLIAGSTGSGKSVLMQNIILGIAATNTPEQARILLIDPKQGVDYFAFEDLPHLDGGIIDDQETASHRLSELVVEMDRRYVRFKEARVPNLAAYNAKVVPDQRLPAIWLIHDEFAEWMLVEDYKESVASVVQWLGVKARAAGIYLVFAAQRPDALVMPMQLRANLGNRLILRVDSEGTSEIALGDKGAERLLGKGHLLAKLEGERDLCFAQVPLVDPLFAEALVGVVRETR